MASVAATEITLLHDDGEPYSSTPELPDDETIDIFLSYKSLIAP